MVAYAVAVGERLPQVVAGVGAAGALTAAVALVLRRPSVFAIGIVGVGAAYAVFLALRHGTVDTRAPFVAAAIFAAAETGFWSVEPLAARATGQATVRRTLLIAGSALLVALAGSMVLVISSGVSGGVALEAVGVAAAAGTAAVVAVVAARAGGSRPS